MLAGNSGSSERDEGVRLRIVNVLHAILLVNEITGLRKHTHRTKIHKPAAGGTTQAVTVLCKALAFSSLPRVQFHGTAISTWSSFKPVYINRIHRWGIHRTAR